jgi:hypothetical protein
LATKKEAVIAVTQGSQRERQARCVRVLSR